MSIGAILDLIRGGLSQSGNVEVDGLHALRSTIFPSKRPMKSITQRAADTICYFPLFVSSSLSINEIAVLSRSIERKLIDLIRIILSNEDLVDVSQGMNKQSVIDMFKGIALNRSDEGETDTRWTNQHVRGSISTPNIREEVISYLINHGDQLVLENITPLNNGLGIGLNEAPAPHSSNQPQESRYGQDAKDFEKFKQSLNDKKKSKGYNVGQVERKMSELAPLTLPVQIYYKAGDRIEETTILVAVKTIVHVIPTEEMVSQVGVSMRDNRLIFRAIQWTTGEISFWKDFVFNMDKLKNDVSNDQKTAFWFWKLRANAKDATTALALKQDHLLPTTTFIMEMSEVETIKRTYGIDLQRSSVAMSMVKLFHLLGFIIVDPATETMWVFDDNSGRFDRTTIPSEERENNNLTKKDMMKTFSALVGSGGSR
jgi:hypothetical protein